MNEKILSQEEINALLDAVGTDQLSVSDRREKRGRESQSGGTAASPGKRNLFPLVRVQTLTKDVQAALALIFDAFAHKGSSTLSTTLRTHINFRFDGMDQMVYGEFIESLPEPSSMWYLGVGPHEQHIAVCLEPVLVQSIISVMMGGGNSLVSKARRNITELEQAVLESVILVFCRELRHAWGRIMEVDLGIDNRETRPRLLQIYPPNEVIVTIHMSMKVGATEGEIVWGIPAPLLKLLQVSINQQSQLENREKLSQMVQKLKESALSFPTTLGARLSETPISVRDLLALDEGQVIKLEHRITDPVVVTVNNLQKMCGQVVRSSDRKAVKVL